MLVDCALLIGTFFHIIQFMEIAEVSHSDSTRSVDLMLIVKVLCLVLITIKLTRMFRKQTSHLERVVSKLSLPYYECFDDFTNKELKQHIQVIRNTIFNRRAQPQMMMRIHSRNTKKVQIN